MGQNISFDKLKIKFIDIVIFTVSSQNFKNTNKIYTYKDLLLFLLPHLYNHNLNIKDTNVIHTSWFDSYYTYCGKEIGYIIWDYDDYYSFGQDNSKKVHFLTEMKINKEYMIIDVFYNLLKQYKLKSLNVKIDKEILDMLIFAIKDICDEKNINNNENDSQQNNNTTNEIFVVRDRLKNFMSLLNSH